ncbi:hypothetical protein SAMN05892877_12189 [Rhizobium subbaraonis]|uniref:Uncharacterized protein n=1 Tax=Rhizobium subbaraonis TaxID=908946 RepID=A0A285UWQ4_9HYPH|nr:hypothetical protein SAMN05892877_12189 [Rhizobium subbaraonis]
MFPCILRGVFVRLISEELILSLKGVTDACYRLGGGVTSFALLTRVGVSTLVKYATLGERRGDGSHEHGATLIPVDIAVEADLRAGSPIITSEMARQLGFRLEPLAERIVIEAPLSEADVLAIMDKATDVWRMARSAFADGRIDAMERRELSQQIRRIIRAAECVLARLEAL